MSNQNNLNVEVENNLTTEVEKTMEENHKELQAIVEALNQDFLKFNHKKVKIAGARVRNNLLNCKKLCDKLRRQIQSEVKILPTRHRIKGDSSDEETKSEEPKVEEVKVEEPKVEEVKVKRTRKANKPKEIKV